MSEIFHDLQLSFSLKKVDTPNNSRPHHIHLLEKLTGYHFDNLHILVEAMNHPSQCHDLLSNSYQRLEFLGDAVLDMVIVSALATVEPELSHIDMHLIKSALVNEHLLAFLCMDMAVEEPDYEVLESENGSEPQVVNTMKRTALCDFMSFDSFEVMKARKSCLSRHRAYEQDIREKIRDGRAYPWSLLVRLGAPKFMSDIIESIVGAIFVDSHGDLLPCKIFLSRLGVMPYLERILQDSVDVLHPKSALNEIAQGKIKFKIGRNEEGFKCFVEVTGKQFMEVSGGLSREEITTRAAEVAYRTILETQLCNVQIP